MSSGGLELLTIKIQQMTIESTDLQNSTNTAITYSECYQQCFCSDNLDLMKTIESNTVDLIYCDILYGTGRKFKDYQDLKPIRSEIESHYVPRIKEMHRILKSTGSIYLQMDTRINHWMRILMDDVFGYENFQNEIVWCYESSGKSKSKYSQKHDVILFYSKSKNFTYNEQYIKSEKNISRYNKIDENGNKYYMRSGKYKVVYKGLKPVTDCFLDLPFLTNNANERNGYPTQKPKALIERIIKASSNEGDLVADFYLGSGTTAEVCKDLNRNFIGCDINPRAIEITLQRLNDARS